ncbi:MAG: hypothetical protein JAZ17_24495 [Candidatus Thiodiazotropha endolucinida]|nr:hypothetical protein [Candidatus Thiodiazotropha endolucinida]
MVKQAKPLITLVYNLNTNPINYALSLVKHAKPVLDDAYSLGKKKTVKTVLINAKALVIQAKPEVIMLKEWSNKTNQ